MRDLIEVAYFTKDVAAMAAFYRQLLGVEPLAASEDMAIFLSGSTKIFIHRAYEVDEDKQLPPENHFAYASQDVDADCQALQAAGLPLELEPQDYYWGRSAYLRDPDGHLIELTQPADK